MTIGTIFDFMHRGQRKHTRNAKYDRELVQSAESIHIEGQYTITGSQIRFDSKSREGVVDCEGELQGESLTLRTYSHINEHRSIREYSFVSLG